VTVEVSDRGSGTVRIPNAPWRFSDADATTSGLPKYPGEDNAEVLQRLLGLSEESVRKLTEGGVRLSRLPKGT
jgi:crotonobetainyl-CoA:carnitine CoA-transferase CaiB-like acyl-CoA transferase